jgi:hypothetical protein
MPLPTPSPRPEPPKHDPLEDGGDAVLLDALIVIVTSPFWIAQLAWRWLAGLWNDWR